MTTEQRERTLTAARRLVITPFDELTAMIRELTGIDLEKLGLTDTEVVIWAMGFSTGIMNGLLEIIDGQ